MKTGSVSDVLLEQSRKDIEVAQSAQHRAHPLEIVTQITPGIGR
jgi:hypothetical protein